MRALVACLAIALGAPLPGSAQTDGAWRTDDLAGGARRASIDARAETPDGVMPAMVKVTCKGGGAGTVCVGLKVEDVERVASFDFGAFEAGGSATALPLFAAKIAEIALEETAAGREGKDPPGSFVFELCGPSQGASPAKALAHAVAAGAGELELAVLHPSRDGRAIRARVPTDAAKGQVATALAKCPADR